MIATLCLFIGLSFLSISLAVWLHSDNLRLRRRLDETNEMYCEAARDLQRAMEQWGECELALLRAEREAKP